MADKRQLLSGNLNPETEITQLPSGFARGLSPASPRPSSSPAQFLLLSSSAGELGPPPCLLVTHTLALLLPGVSSLICGSLSKPQIHLGVRRPAGLNGFNWTGKGRVLLILRGCDMRGRESQIPFVMLSLKGGGSPRTETALTLHCRKFVKNPENGWLLQQSPCTVTSAQKWTWCLI